MANSRLARIVIALTCACALAGSYAFHTLPLSSLTPPSWYHHPAIVIPGVLLTLPAILVTMGIGGMIPRDGGVADRSISQMLSTIDPLIIFLWCVMMFFLLNRVVLWFEQRYIANRLKGHRDHLTNPSLNQSGDSRRT